MTTKERAKLRKEAMELDSIIQIGKEGLTDAILVTIRQAIENRELIKINVLDNSGEETKAMANLVADKINADVIQVIGHKFVLYKYNPKKKRK